jgi:hypothetical protein
MPLFGTKRFALDVPKRKPQPFPISNPHPSLTIHCPIRQAGRTVDRIHLVAGGDGKLPGSSHPGAWALGIGKDGASPWVTQLQPGALPSNTHGWPKKVSGNLLAEDLTADNWNIYVASSSSTGGTPPVFIPRVISFTYLGNESAISNTQYHEHDEKWPKIRLIPDNDIFFTAGYVVRNSYTPPETHEIELRKYDIGLELSRMYEETLTQSQFSKYLRANLARMKSLEKSGDQIARSQSNDDD